MQQDFFGGFILNKSMKIYSFFIFLSFNGCRSGDSPGPGVIHLKINKNNRDVIVEKNNSYTSIQTEKTNQRFSETYTYKKKELMVINYDFESGVFVIKHHDDPEKIRLIVDFVK